VIASGSATRKISPVRFPETLSFPGYPLIGHLKYPKHYRHPIALAKPVAVITADLFKHRRTYPNLPEGLVLKD
jgi:hypothetical protein